MISSKCFRRATITGLVATTALISVPASADTELRGYPSQWRLQDYEDGAITLFYTGSPCTSGELIMPASAPAESRARLWSLLMTAAGLNKQIGIFYDAGCHITDFYGF